MITISSIPSHSLSVVSKRIKGEYLLIPLTKNIADMDSLYKLNETGAFIWDAIDGNRTISDITLMVTEEFETGWIKAEEDTLEFITEIQNFLQIREM
jgi:hypothetical protein